MKKILCLLNLLALTAFVFAQNGSWIEPAQPYQGDTVTVYFNPLENSETPDSPNTLNLHWGINQTNYGEWRLPSSSLWPEGTVQSGNGAVRSPLTKVDDSTWYVKIYTGTEIKTLHYVVNDGTPSQMGDNWAHNTGGGNWDIDILEGGLSITLLSPDLENSFSDYRLNPFFFTEDQDLIITAKNPGKTIDSIQIFIEEDLAFTEYSDTLRYSLEKSSMEKKSFSMIFRAFSGVSSISDSIWVVQPLKGPYESRPYDGLPGIHYVNEGTVMVSLFAPGKDFVYVIGEFNDWVCDSAFQMKKDSISPDSVVFWRVFTGLDPFEEIQFQYFVDGAVRIADPYTEKTADPWNDGTIPIENYPSLKPYPSEKTWEPAGYIYPQGMEDESPPVAGYLPPKQEELIIYELLTRDFTESSSFQGIMDSLPYLKKLGVNAIELMPVNEFEGNNSWGYNPSFYFAVDKYYGNAGKLKELVKRCHSNGIAVILDMVFNHAYGQCPLVRLYWDEEGNKPSADNPWFNQESPNPVFSWGYDFNHESVHTENFVKRCVNYWLDEYGVDGFRLDFTKGFTNKPGDGSARDDSRIAILKQINDFVKENHPRAYVILEHFADNSEEKELAAAGMMLWGNKNYNYNEATMGYNGWDDGKCKSDFSDGIYQSRGWEKPRLVTYMESHDEERLMFKNLEYGNGAGDYQIKDLPTALNRIKLAAAFFLPIPGPKMIWQFGELGYDYSINENGRTGEKPVRWDYLDVPDRKSLYRTYSALLDLRYSDSIFYSGNTAISYDLNNIDGTKLLKLSLNDKNVIIIGHFGVTGKKEFTPGFQQSGAWYRYFQRDSLQIDDTNAVFTLNPGELMIFADFKLPDPDSGLVTAIEETSTPTLSSLVSAPYPNPFKNELTVPLSPLLKQKEINYEIFNMLGEKINKGTKAILSHSLIFSEEFRNTPSGVYFIRLKELDQIRKVAHIK